MRLLHHDVWTGPASDLLLKEGIGVIPIKGWWGDRKCGTAGFGACLIHWSPRSRRSDVDVDAQIYQEVAAIVELDARIGVETAIS